MRYISIFSGIEAASVAWEPLGFEPVAFSEIDDFPSAVLAQRYPNVPNLGDITKVDWSPYHGSVDLVVGGSPCQSFSVAGDRSGLAGASGLMFEFIRAVHEIAPRWFLWENVPGALSVEDGYAFKQLLGEMDHLGYGMAWRVLDAQFFNVPQRRERLFLVGSFGDQRAAEVLFERKGVRGDIVSGRKARETFASAAGSRPPASYTLKLRHTGSDVKGAGVGALVQEDISATVQVSQDQTLFQAVTAIQGDIARGARFTQNGCGYQQDGSCYTLNTMDEHAVAYVDPSSFKYKASTSARSIGFEIGVAPTIDTENKTGVMCMADVTSNADVDENLAGTIGAHSAKEPPVLMMNDNTKPAVEIDMSGTLVTSGSAPILSDSVDETRYIVRRLTPTECERLQGFPDGWTDVEFKGKPAPDSRRYKALGNSMAVPVMRWIGQRILLEDLKEG